MEKPHGGDGSNKLVQQLEYNPRVAVEKTNEVFHEFKTSEGILESAVGGDKGFAVAKHRSREINFIQQAGAVPYILNSYTYAMNLSDGKWRNAINNNALVSAVADGVAFQKNLKTTGGKGVEIRGQSKGTLFTKDPLAEDVVEKQTPEKSNMAESQSKSPEDFVRLAEDALGDSKKNMEVQTLEENAPKKKRTPEDFGTLTKEAFKRMEGVKEVLDVRNEKTRERLLDMGLSGLVKGVEAWKNVSPRKKFLVGLTLAGASVASGGLTSFISKGLSTLTYASSHYNEKLKTLEEKGEEIDKRKLAVQSVARGFILAMASSQLIGLLAPHIPEAIEVVKEKFSSVKDGVKEWFLSFKDAVPDTGTAMTPDMDTSVFPNGFTSPEYTVSVPDSLGAGESLIGPDIMVLPDYVIQPGDNLTKIIKEHVIKTIPGYQSLSPFQQNNMIENLLKQAALNKDASFYEAINKFADPRGMVPGKIANLTQIRDALTGYKFNDFGGKSILEHARGSYEYTSSPSTASTYDYVSSSPSVATSYPPVNPADFGAMDATPKDVEVLANGQTGEPIKPLTPEEIIELNDKVLQKNGVGGVEGVQGREFTSQA